MKNLNSSNINGYIEGYYGKLLNWEDRKRIIQELSLLKFNYYFYCPKEDPFHRIKWRFKYSKSWVSSFNKFCSIAKEYNIKLLIGIAPGLDFDFYNYNNDFEILIKKIKQILNKNKCKLVLMFDDINDNFSKKFPSLSEGRSHAKLANDLSDNVKEELFVVPRIYADELILPEENYLEEFCKNINTSIPIFYCGKNIVSETTDEHELTKLKSITKNKIILWDNIYANDYCPRRLFLGPYLNRSNFNNVMVNLTGMIETDIFLLNIIKSSISKKKINIEKKFNIPKSFFVLNKYFKTINDNNEKSKINFKKDIGNLDILLWKWKTPLSLEWYPYLLGLKQDLLLLYNKITLGRIKKTQTLPFTNIIQKLKEK
jgi:hyaluronoglucosaminidase